MEALNTHKGRAQQTLRDLPRRPGFCGLAAVRLELGNIHKMTGPGPGEGQVPPRGHVSVQALTPQRGCPTDEEICNGLSTVLSSFLAGRHTTAAQKRDEGRMCLRMPAYFFLNRHFTDF